MQQLFIEVNREKFSVEFKEVNGTFQGYAYPIVEWERAGTQETGWSYVSKSAGCEMHETLNDDCRTLFEFSFCWRGVWEGRVYFKDEEYWSEELKTISLLWDKIEGALKELVRQTNPLAVTED